MKDTKISVRRLSVSFNGRRALDDVSIDFRAKRVTALIGPSGCGKSTLLRALNRMIDLTPDAETSGEVLIDDVDIRRRDVDVNALRRTVGTVFQNPTVFPKSVFENLVFGARVAGEKRTARLEEIAERAATDAGIWNEIKDRLNEPATNLSGGQRQRLCIARAFAVEPEVLLMDEPTGDLDRVSTAKIEELILQLRKRLTVVLVTHNIQQAARVSDFTAFFDGGKLVEFDKTQDIFTNPTHPRTEDYVTGRFG
jgi:phosphate transport system ATP-binding protein